ncbi:MAG TPA: TolC family protein [Candidatus Angelobacter sp.]|nr:TolC family protein [Candidatus Angelobacter sp.]
MKQRLAGVAAGVEQVFTRSIPRLGLFWLIFPISIAAQTNPPSVNLGSVPSGTATSEVLHLTLRDAIARALRYNLGQIESGENVRIARGQRLRALSALLPQVNAGGSENVEQFSAATLGIKIQQIPAVIGPFSYSTAQASASQILFSVESMQRFRAARNAEQAAQFAYRDTLDVITLIVGNAYLEVIQARSRITAAEAQVQNARALYNQALEQLQAGTNPKIDVTRSGVQLHTEQYNLSIARNNFAIAKLNLSRAIGLPLGQAFDLTDQLPYAEVNPPTVEDALKTAYKGRSDFRAALSSIKSAQEQLAAARGERYPVLAANGDYGVQGPTFGRLHGTLTFHAGVSVPIFTGGRIKGDMTEAEGTLRQRKAEAENLRGQIDYDVRTAFLNLQAATEQVTVARQNVNLANENLSRSQERFATGVTDSVEVVQAQQAMASANDQYISGLYSHNVAKLQLARALGVARTNFSQYLAVQ